MAEEKKLEQQGKSLLRLSVFLIILAVGMLIVLFDIYFVPSGAEWEEMKQEYADESEEKSDKEMWQELRDAGRENGNFKTPSNILNWIVAMHIWNREKQEKIQHEESLRLADTRAAEFHEYISGLANEYDIQEKIVFYIFISESGRVDAHHDCYNYEGDVIQKCEEMANRIGSELSDKYPDETASIAASVSGGTCKAVAYAPDIKNALEEGLDFPYFDDEGNFDYSQNRGYGITHISKNGFIIGLSPQQKISD